ncbi:hypothetical protein Pst134EA_011354 [Puccinia striiformis f. sp. tritici]|uniref:hypothetical protein n=1 Tax=Puccinia striiformis f. sp. tritici TaxID=168172 RepID=UPI002008029B|nr:hypothetical protein Pst134EA_011354 [Puccinia striiformis f. sp. tritici]KAH9467722.1 hypothetical protein Pst134EA_011354 [Puccinia striiformis f. sp. tritici]
MVSYYDEIEIEDFTWDENARVYHTSMSFFDFEDYESEEETSDSSSINEKSTPIEDELSQLTL